MSWIEQLIQTYDNCSEHIGQSDGATPLLPICHSTQNAHIEVIIDGNGAFKRAHVISKDESETIIPCTEESGGRTGSKPINHPLCDKLQYLGGDFLKFGGVVTSGYLKNPEKPHIKYLEELHQWCVSEHRHPKVEAIYAYLSKGSLISDLCSAGILPYDMSTGKLTKIWEGPLKEGPEIFRVMPKGKAPEEAFVRWVVEIPNDPSSKLWKDESVWKSWALYYAASQAEIKDICYVTGQVTQLAKQHPAKLRHAADKAKLISSNDTGGFTYRGRFNDCKGRQACGIGYEVTQKAHNALRWLLARQGYNDGNLAVVAWAVSGQKIPDPLGDSSLLSDEELPTSNKS